MKNLFIFPHYILFFLIKSILSCIYKREDLSESNRDQVYKMLNLLLKTIQVVNKQDLRVIIKYNRFTKNMIYILNYTHNNKKLVFKKSVNNYFFLYKGEVIRFTEENKHVLKQEWKKLNPPPLFIFEA